MDFSEYFRLVSTSTPQDWQVIACWGGGSGPSYRDRFTTVWQRVGTDTTIEVESHSLIATYKPDLRISLAFGMKDNEDFKEPWANKYDDPRASSSFLDFFFGAILVHREIYVVVDGGRGNLPLPRPVWDEQSKSVTRYEIAESQSAFFRTFNNLEANLDYNHYLGESGFSVVEGPWPR